MNPRHRRSPKNLVVNDVFPDWYKAPLGTGYGGIFYYLSGMDVPWEEYDQSGHTIKWQLDVTYHGEHSGQKFISPMVYPYLDDEGELSSTNAGYLAAAIAYKFREKWTHLWNLYHIQYSPLANYHMEETRERDATSDVDKTTVRTPDLTERTDMDDSSETELDRTDEITHGHVITTGEQRAESGQGNIFGFNSVEAVPTDSDTGTETATTVETHSGKDTTVIDSNEHFTKDTTDIKTTTGTDTVEEGSGVVDHEEEIVIKEGNLFKVPYEMLEGDRAFWMDDYFSIVFEDIDSVLCLSIYPEREINTKVY